MKRVLFIFLAFILLTVASAFGEKTPGELTIMVYMCGSDLESNHGSASADIQEMLDAEFDPDKISLLVMTGGSESWDRGFSSSQLLIHEISAHRIRTVLTDDQANMGSSRTLTKLLQFGKENYPAENYALILWDHGGGPLEGICWDELYAPDNLNLYEISEGIKNAALGQKLSWIGFDACLMSSLETASALAPYAEYMIASQETEPPAGWNYAFLNGIETDAYGAMTGKRIIDAFFEGRENDPDVLTLTCTDLERAMEAAAAMDDFFGTISRSVSQENYSRLAGIRLSSTGFGKAVRSYGDDGYDLVDAIDLVTRLSEIGNTGTALPDLLSSSIVYNRSNEAGANGLTLYHPLVNKAKYLREWRDSYEKLGFSKEYTRYIQAFGTLLTGAELVDWSGLEIRDEGTDDQNHFHFSLQLSEDQYTNFSYGQLYILQRIGEGTDRESFVPVYVDKAEAGQNGLLTGEFTGRTLYAEVGDGSLAGPLGFMQTETGEHNFIYTIYSKTYLGSDQSALYYFEADDTNNDPEIVRQRAWNAATESFTSRSPIREENYNYLKIINIHRYLPQPDETGILPAFEKWETNVDLIRGEIIDLPEEWRLRYLDTPSDFEDLFAMFEITDLQQNTYSSPMIPVRKLHSDPITFTPEASQTGDYGIVMSGEVVSSPLESGLRFSMLFTNNTGRTVRFSLPADGLILNDRRIAAYTAEVSRPEVPSGKTAEWSFRIDPAQLRYLREITSLSLNLEVQEDPESYDTKELPLRFSVTGGDISRIVPEAGSLGETEQDGLMIRLLAVEPNISHSGFDLLLYVKNDSGTDFAPAFSPLINGIQTDKAFNSRVMPAGRDGFIRIPVRNDISAGRIGESFFDETILAERVLQPQGDEKIEEITFLFRTKKGEMDEKTVTLRPDKPADMTHGEYHGLGKTILPPREEAGKAVLINNEVYEVWLRRVLFSEKAITLALELRNKTDQPLELLTDAIMLNDSVPMKGAFEEEYWNSVILAPKSVKITALHLLDQTERPEGQLSIDTISVMIRAESQIDASPAVISFPDPVPFGGSRFIWIESDEPDIRAATDEAVFREPVIPELDENGNQVFVSKTIICPENASEYKFWQSSCLTEAQAAGISGGLGMLVYKPDETHIIPLSMAGIRPDEDNIPGALFSGLMLCSGDSPLTCFCMNENISDESFEPEILTKPTVITDSYQFLKVDELGIRLDYVSDQAEMTSLVVSDEVQWDGASGPYSVQILSIGFLFDPGQGSLEKYISQAPRSRFSASVPLNGEPLRFRLRPIAEEDELYILFSFRRNDGTEFSLPLIPYTGTQH